MGRQHVMTAAVAGGVRPHPHIAERDAYEDVVALTVDETGLIHDCSRTAEKLFKYNRQEIIDHHVSMMLPQLADIELMSDGEPNPAFRFLCRIGQLFHAVAKSGERIPCELFLTALYNKGQSGLLLIVRPAASTSAEDEEDLPRKQRRRLTTGRR